MSDGFLYKPLDGIASESNQIESDHFLQIYAAQSTLLNILGWFYKSYKFGVDQTIENLHDQNFYEKSNHVMQNFHKKLNLPPHCNITPLTLEKIEASFIIHSISTLYNLRMVTNLMSKNFSLEKIMICLFSIKLIVNVNQKAISISLPNEQPFYIYKVGENNEGMKNNLLKFAQGLFEIERRNNTLIVENLLNIIPELITIHSNEFLKIADILAPNSNFKSHISKVTLEVYEKAAKSIFGDMIKNDEDTKTGILILANIIDGFDPAIRHLMT